MQLFCHGNRFIIRMKNKGGIPAGVKNIVEDGEPLPAGIQYSCLLYTSDAADE